MAHHQKMREKRSLLVAVLLMQDASPIYTALLACLKPGKMSAFYLAMPPRTQSNDKNRPYSALPVALLARGV